MTLVVHVTGARPNFPKAAPVLEALGAGIEVPADTAVTHAALRTSTTGADGRVWITGRAAGWDGTGDPDVGSGAG